MKVILIWAMLLFVITSGHAEPKRSFLFLEKISELEYAMNSSIKYYALGNSFPRKVYFGFQAAQSAKTFSNAMRHLSVDLKSSTGARTIELFAKAKYIISSLSGSNIENNKLAKLVKIKRELQEELNSKLPQMLMALSPEQKIAFLLDNSRQILADLILEYTYVGKDNEKSSQLEKNINDFENGLSSIISYQYWNDDDKKIISKISNSWKNLQEILGQRSILLLGNIGSEHMESLLLQLKKSFTKKLQG